MSHQYLDFFKNNIKEQSFGNKCAGGIFIAKDTGRILLCHRSDNVSDCNNTWGTWGGHLNSNENAVTGLMREIEEETGFKGKCDISPIHAHKNGDFEYNNFIILVPFEFVPQLNWENKNSSWVEFGEWPDPMHHGLEELLLISGEKLSKIVEVIKNKNKMQFKESMDSPPAIHQNSNSTSPDFINYIKHVENGVKSGYENGKWHVYISPEGIPHIAYGHKLVSGEADKFRDGISDSEAERILKNDISTAKANVYSDIKHMFNVSIPLDNHQEEMLMDYVFNLGTLRSFPKFTKAVLNKDWNTAKQEYKRSFKDLKGNSHEMGRNVDFYNKFLKEDELPKFNNITNKRGSLVDDGVHEYELSMPHSWIDYKKSDDGRMYWIESIGTDPDFRNQGRAKELLDRLFKLIKETNGMVSIGGYLDGGEMHLKKVVERLAHIYKIRTCD